MNAMADGAAQRCVAQIGEALFGQPGMTLMELAEKVKQHDLSLDQTIGERDRYHEVADALAGHIAAITGVNIGEHSSANCPWQDAIEAADEYQPAQAVDLGQFREAVMHAYGVVVPEDYCEKLGELLDLIDGKVVRS